MQLPLLNTMGLALAGLLATAAASTAFAADFEKDIRPILQSRCVECHGPQKQKGGLRLDARAFAFKGGEKGAVISPNDPGHSSLWNRINATDDDERMPPKGERLTAIQSTLIRDWISAGAVWPESQADRDAAADKRLQHWAFQPVKSISVPAASGTGSNPIDAFIRAKLQEKQLHPSPEADRRTLIRRLSFDLLGLPPTPEEVQAFERDHSPRAYEDLVDRLLQSPHYGERWARHWLDIAHYADTHGFERDQIRPNAWRYRDYVIDALNSDKRYDRFIREQIAGDVLSPGDPDSVIATGFLAAGPWDFVGQVETKSPALNRAARAGDLDDIVTQVITATMGLTINCARCHDHKLDPITQKEYYQLTSVFAGVKRAERDIDAQESQRIARKKAALEKRSMEVSAEIGRLSGEALDLADMAGGGNGRGTGIVGAGILLNTGEVAQAKLGYHKDFKPNQLTRVHLKTADFVQGVFLPNGPGSVTLPDGIVLHDLPKTSGHSWDAIRNGALNAQTQTMIGGTDYAGAGHSMLGLHANGAITFSLAAMRRAHGADALRFTGIVAFGSKSGADNTTAGYSVFVDGELKARGLKMRKHETALVDIPLPATAKYLTLMATDGGDGIGYDLLFFGDARVRPDTEGKHLTTSETKLLAALKAERASLAQALKQLPQSAKVYAIDTQPRPAIHILRRGNPEDALEEVSPGTMACVRQKPADFTANSGSREGEARKTLADWIASPDNPLTRRVLVNRLWHHHFGQGLVNTPSDFGLGGDRPSHPELLDWLAGEFLRSGWSLKAMHRLICNSATYRQISAGTEPDAARIDASNRLLWRQNPRRLDAESVRDAVLAVSGNLNPARGGPGFRDFDYTEAYAPIYQYTVADKPELWKRSIYRLVVRTTPHQFLTTLDCPDPANLTPARVVTTTALQALTLSNNAFMLRQAGSLAGSISQQTGLSPTAQITRAFERVFQRPPNQEEFQAAAALIKTQNLFSLCRMLINANEFLYID